MGIQLDTARPRPTYLTELLGNFSSRHDRLTTLVSLVRGSDRNVHEGYIYRTYSYDWFDNWLALLRLDFKLIERRTTENEIDHFCTPCCKRSPSVIAGIVVHAEPSQQA